MNKININVKYNFEITNAFNIDLKSYLFLLFAVIKEHMTQYFKL